MRKLALFAVVAVGAAAIWEISKHVQDNPIDNTGSDSENLSTETPSVDSSSILDPVKDTIVTITRSIFGTPYDALIASSAATYNIPSEVLYKLLYQESRFRPDIIDGRTKSPTGALGIAQFMPATALEELGSVEAALDPAKAIPGAARYLAKLRTQLGGDLTKAVAAYNWGIGNVKRKGLAAAPTETRKYALAILGVTLA
jgi:soluble lytic murein transglycosylase-like protein